MKLTPAEVRTLKAILHGAQDDDDGRDGEYSAALNSLMKKVSQPRSKRKAALR